MHTAVILTIALSYGFFLPLYAWSLLTCLGEMIGMPDKKKVLALLGGIVEIAILAALLILIVNETTTTTSSSSNDGLGPAIYYSLDFIIESTFYVPFAFGNNHGLFIGAKGLNSLTENWYEDFLWTNTSYLISPKWLLVFVAFSGLGPIFVFLGLVASAAQSCDGQEFDLGKFYSTSFMLSFAAGFLLLFGVVILLLLFRRIDDFKQNGKLQRNFFFVCGLLMFQIPATLHDLKCMELWFIFFWVEFVMRILTILEERTFSDSSCLGWLETDGFPGFIPNFIVKRLDPHLIVETTLKSASPSSSIDPSKIITSNVESNLTKSKEHPTPQRAEVPSTDDEMEC